MKNRKSKNNRFLFYYVCRHKLWMSLLLVGVVGASIVGLLYPLVTADIVNKAFYEKEISGMSMSLVTFIVVFVVHQCFHFIRTYSYAKLRATFSVNIKRDIYSGILSYKGDVFSEKLTGDWIMRLGNDTDQILDYIYFNVFYTVTDFVEFIVQLVLIYFISPYFFVLTLLCMPTSFCLTKMFVAKSENVYKRQKESKKAMSSFFFEVIQGMKELRVLNGFGWMIETFLNVNHQNNKNIFSISTCEVKNGKISEGIALIIHLCLYSLSAILIINGHLKLGSFLAAVEYFNASISIFSDIANKGNPIANGIASLKRITEMFDYKKEKYDEGQAINFERGNIEFRDCEFSYKNSKVLRHCSFDVEGGEIVAIAGENGSGKSTLIQLLLRFYDLDNGAIYIDGFNIKDTNIVSLRNQLAVVFQKVMLFERTVRYNLIISDDKRRDDEIWDKLDKVGLKEEILKLPNKLDTVIGGDGISFSGGQNQRIGIARALLKDSKILIFDESTSALDEETEVVIRNTIRRLAGEKTIIMITHKREMLEFANKVIYLKNGKIMGKGTHNCLCKENKEYLDFINVINES